MPIVRQTSFAGGELAPTLYARTELDRYKIGVRKLLNFLVTPFGAAANRPGTQCLGAAKTGTDCAQARLGPFIFSDEQALVLEFGYHYVRFWLNGVLVLAPWNGMPCEAATTYAVADLPRLKFAQMGNIITITNPGYSAYELTRATVNPLTFTWTAIAFDVPACPITSIGEISWDNSITPILHAVCWKWAATAICQSLDGTRTWETLEGGNFYIELTNVAAWGSGTTYGLGDYVNYGGHTWKSSSEGNLNHNPSTSPDWWYRQSFLNGGQLLSLTEHKPVIQWVEPTVTTFRIISMCLYRGQNDVLGLMTTIKSGNTMSFTDNGETEPDYLTRPPKGENPFKIYSAAGALVRTEEPATVTYQDERLIFGGTAERPNYLFMSRVGDWHNFDQYPNVKDDDSISVGLAGRRFEEIRSLVPGRSLLTLTAMSEWAVDGGQPDQPMTPTAISARIRSERGSTWLDALKVGDDHVLFVQRKGMIVRDLRYDGDAGTYVNSEVSMFSHHLLAGRTVVAWTWAEDPWSIVWLVLSDGTLLSITFMPEQKVLAWSQHALAGGGLVESICSIPEGEEDAVYMIVLRGGVRYVERMASRTVTDVRKDAIFLDASVSYHLATAQVTFSGLTHLNGLSAYLLVDGNVMGPYTVAGGICDPGADFQITDIAAYDAGTTYVKDDYVTYGGYTWRALEVLSAGVVIPNVGNTPADGTHWTYVHVHVGLRYDCDLETLDLGPGEGKTRVKNIKELSIEFEAARGLWVGEDFDHLSEWNQRAVEDSYATIGAFTGQAKFHIGSTWNHGGRAVLRQVDPLPVTVLAITREVEYGG